MKQKLPASAGVGCCASEDLYERIEGQSVEWTNVMSTFSDENNVKSLKVGL